MRHDVFKLENGIWLFVGNFSGSHERVIYKAKIHENDSVSEYKVKK
jgi:hypothetical protein